MIVQSTIQHLYVYLVPGLYYMLSNKQHNSYCLYCCQHFQQLQNDNDNSYDIAWSLFIKLWSSLVYDKLPLQPYNLRKTLKLYSQGTHVIVIIAHPFHSESILNIFVANVNKSLAISLLTQWSFSL